MTQKHILNATYMHSSRASSGEALNKVAKWTYDIKQKAHKLRTAYPGMQLGSNAAVLSGTSPAQQTCAIHL